MKRIPTTVLGSLALGVCLSGCSTLYKVDVYATSEAEGDQTGNYVIVPADSDYQYGNPEFEQLVSLLDAALTQQGYARHDKDDWQSADIAIYVSSDVSEPGRVYRQVSAPVYEPPIAEAPPPRNAGGASQSTSSSGGSTSSQPMPVPIPQEDRLIGYTKMGFSHEVYAKTLRVVAVDLQQYLGDIAKQGAQAAKPRELWRVDIESTGSPKDMQRVLPVLVAAGQPWFGRATDDTVHVRLTENDRRVTALSATAR